MAKASKSTPRTKPRFTQKQMAFMRAYVVNPNATQAAIEAGYSKKTAKQQGNRLLTKVDLKALVDKALQRIAERQQVRAEEVIAHTKYIGLSNMFDYILYDDDGHPYFDLKKIEKHDFMLGAAVHSI
ncbi:MAG: terminase small subunit, partial [Candidatus Hydrogenedentota bacterium]